MIIAYLKQQKFNDNDKMREREIKRILPKTKKEKKKESSIHIKK